MAVVTGAGSGIGRAFALEIARRGGAVLCSDINLETVRETVSLIEREGGQAWAFKCDVSKLTQVEALAEEADRVLPGPVSLVINNAGVGVGGLPVGETPIKDGMDPWHQPLGGDPRQPCSPAAETPGYGGIINVASTAGFSAAPLMAFITSKAGALALTETLAAELAAQVAVTALCPTLVKTNTGEWQDRRRVRDVRPFDGQDRHVAGPGCPGWF